jgi:Flp pilus assembly protein CpaB
MAMRRSTQMLLLGVAVFVIGAGVVLLSLKGSGDGSSADSLVTTTTIQAGTIVVPAAAGVAPTTFSIPEGKQAVAVQMPYVAGLAGYAKAADVVNIYANVEKGQIAETIPPSSKLLVAGVPVLAVTGPAPGAEAGNATYLLALDASQAEQVIFFARFESMWLTLAPKDQPKPQTSGRSYKNAF